MKYTTRYALTPDIIDSIKAMYSDGYSSIEIKELLELQQTARTIQRHISNAGITRNKSDSFKLAINKGRMIYSKLPKELKQQRKRLSSGIRFRVLQQSNYRCIACGAMSKDARLEVDHIDNDPTNNILSNLQVLCDYCNKGKYRSII